MKKEKKMITIVPCEDKTYSELLSLLIKYGKYGTIKNDKNFIEYTEGAWFFRFYFNDNKLIKIVTNCTEKKDKGMELCKYYSRATVCLVDIMHTIEGVEVKIKEVVKGKIQNKLS